MNPWLSTLLGLVAGYVLGSVPTSYVAGRLLRGIDLREHGSGNLGATNVFRVLGWLPAIPVLLIDMAKGALAVALGLSGVLGEGPSSDAVALAGAVGAILGHSFSPWVGFRGGKGVAAAAGAFLTLAPWGTVPAFVVWLVLLLITRIMSIASITAAVVLPVSLIAYEISHPHRPHPWATLLVALLMGVLVVLRHRSNLARIREGTEKALWR